MDVIIHQHSISRGFGVLGLKGCRRLLPVPELHIGGPQELQDLIGGIVDFGLVLPGGGVPAESDGVDCGHLGQGLPHLPQQRDA